MASNFDKYAYDLHGVAHSTLMLGTDAGGHFYNMINEEEDIENGSVALLKPENYVEDDMFTTEVPATTDKVVLILTAPKIYEEYTIKMQEESQFWNGAGEVMRAYEIFETDRFSLSVEAFDESADVAVGKYVVVTGSGYKLTTTDSDPGNTYGFVGYIYKQWPNGTYAIFVKRNREVE